MYVPTRPEWVSWRPPNLAQKRGEYLQAAGVTQDQLNECLAQFPRATVDHVILCLFKLVQGRDLIVEYGGQWETFLDAHDRAGIYPAASDCQNHGMCINYGYFWYDNKCHAAKEPEKPEPEPEPEPEPPSQEAIDEAAKNPLCRERWEAGLDCQGVPAKYAPEEKPPEVPEGPIPETTMEHWEAQGYTPEQAAHIANWVKTNEMVPTPEKIGEIIVELEPEPETELHKAWREYAENPDVIGFLGLLPSSTIESFSRVFTGYSYIDDKPAEARDGDLVAVSAIIAGLALATVGALSALVPTAAAGSAATAATFPSGQAITNIMTNFSQGLATATTKAASIRYIATSQGMISTAIQGAPGTAVLLFKQLMAMPMAYKVAASLSGLYLLTQLDGTGWFFGLSPEAGHNKVAKLLGSIRSDLIRLDGLVDDKQWDEANKIVPTIKAQLSEAVRLMDAWPVKFWATFGFSMDDKQALLDGEVTNLETYLTQYPQLSSLPTVFPKEFELENAQVEDGDTLIFPGHPGVQDRIRMLGIDAHEAETASGIEETAYLKSLIEGKTVTIKTHEFGDPEKTIGYYGRLLGGVFLGDQDIALAMLEHFGKQILTATRYQDKYRWIDWDFYKKVAEEAKGPAVLEFKINIDSEPSNAKLHIDGTYTHHLTPSNEKELKDVMDMLAPGEHTFKATKAGKEGSVIATITDRGNPDIFITLKTVGLEPEPPTPGPEPEPEPTPEEPEEFQINILSTPSRAKVYIDGIYVRHLTPTDQVELRRGPYYGIDYFTPGEHVIKATKGGKSVEKNVTIVEGFNEPIYLTLKVVGLPEPEVPLIPCGPAAAFYTLNKIGVPRTVEQVRADLPTIKIPLTTEEFTFPETLAAYISAQGVSAEFMTNKTLDDLKAEIDAGNQVIVLGNIHSARWGLDLPHFWNVTGYDDITKTINNVNAPNYSYDEFETRWKMLPISFLPIYDHSMIVVKK